MIPVFNTRKIRHQLKLGNREILRRVGMGRERAIFESFIRRIEPIHFKPDLRPHAGHAMHSAPRKERAAQTVACYEIPEKLTRFYHEMGDLLLGS
jgi:hypothetical protein